MVNGSIIYFSECGPVHPRLPRASRSSTAATPIEVRDDVHDAFNQRVDDANRRMAWGISTVNTWYKNTAGNVTQNWPFTLLEYWERTREPDPADYEFVGDPVPPRPRLSSAAAPGVA